MNLLPFFPTKFPPQIESKRDSKKSIPDLKKHCTYCNGQGHSYEQCFERIGYPDWYKGKKGKKKPAFAAPAMGTWTLVTPCSIIFPVVLHDLLVLSKPGIHL